MSKSNGDSEIGELSEIYDELRGDAKAIVNDLRGGVAMWREAAGANLAAAGFICIMALTTFHYGPFGIEGAVLILAEVVLAVVMLGYSVVGFRKYFRLRRKYQGLFERADKLD
jgi:hypothetical protein